MSREERTFPVGQASSRGGAGSSRPQAGVSREAVRPMRSPLTHALAATGDQWTLLIVSELAVGASRLARLQERLPGISTGVLDRHLHQMAALGLLSRERFREAPPRVEVSLTDSGRELLPIAGALARWGMRHMWFVSNQMERVDIHACLGLLPILLEEVVLPAGAVELVLTPAREHRPRVFRVENGRLQFADPLDGGVTARVEGDDRAWVAALGPSSDYSLLTLAGNKRLVREILNALPRRGS